MTYSIILERFRTFNAEVRNETVSALDLWKGPYASPPSSPGGQRARMPLLIFGVDVAEPAAARHTVHRRRIIARLIVRRHALTQALRVRALRFFFIHRPGSCHHSTPVHLKCIRCGAKADRLLKAGAAALYVERQQHISVSPEKRQ